MDQMLTFITNNIKTIVSTLSAILVFFISVKKNFFSKDRVLKGKYLHFKAIKKEYTENKINGYFALQQYFNARLSTEEMDCIIESPDAYIIFNLLKVAIGKYEFKDNKFIPKITRRNYILPFVGYITSCFFLSIQFISSNYLLTNISMYSFIIILIINLCINVPILINCLSSINEIKCTLKLCGLNTNKKDKETKNA